MESVRAYAPGSVTTVFAPPGPDGDRSSGASLATADGVVVEVAAAADVEVLVDGEPAPFEPVEYLLADLGVAATVDVRPAVPLGCGFGASGAATLAAALAAAELFDLGNERAELVEAAHAAEVKAGTGLGDVFVQDRGGLVVGTGDGIGRTEPDERIEYASFGPVATDEVLADEATMRRIREAGEAALAGLPAEPSLAELVSSSWEFAGETGLVTDRVEREVARVHDAGGVATAAMVGETVVATDVDGVLERETQVENRGARLL